MQGSGLRVRVLGGWGVIEVWVRASELGSQGLGLRAWLLDFGAWRVLGAQVCGEL